MVEGFTRSKLSVEAMQGVMIHRGVSGAWLAEVLGRLGGHLLPLLKEVCYTVVHPCPLDTRLREYDVEGARV